MNKRETAKQVRAALRAAGEQAARYTGGGYMERRNVAVQGHISGFRISLLPDAVRIIYEPPQHLFRGADQRLRRQRELRRHAGLYAEILQRANLMVTLSEDRTFVLCRGVDPAAALLADGCAPSNGTAEHDFDAQ